MRQTAYKDWRESENRSASFLKLVRDEGLILLDEKGRRYFVRLDAPIVQVGRSGVLSSDRLRSSVGRTVEIGSRRLLVLHPSARDLWETMERGAQALTPKDLGSILFESDVHAGGRVVESGSGSGALTIALARAVGPAGRVWSIDRRAEAIATARTNVERAGLQDTVEFQIGDVRRGIGVKDVDAVLLDLPDPWLAIPSAWDALRPTGHFVSFSPNMEQVKQTVLALRDGRFAVVRTLELIEREMEVRDIGVRPSFSALGHTGYLTFARKVLDTF